MWIYEKKLQYPVRVSKCDPRLAKYLIEQYVGADGELSAALRRAASWLPARDGKFVSD